jgi:hypothetical protein
MTNRNGDHRMILVLRIATIAVALLIGAAAVASANTMELTLTVPLTITLPKAGTASPALDGAGGAPKLKPFDVSCVVGSNLGYATGSGAQGKIIGTGSTATSGTKAIVGPAGQIVAAPKATVIITYDDGAASAGPGNAVGSAAVSNYLCWVVWQTPIPSLAPIFVQGTLNPQ